MEVCVVGSCFVLIAASVVVDDDANADAVSMGGSWQSNESLIGGVRMSPRELFWVVLLLLLFLELVF